MQIFSLLHISCSSGKHTVDGTRAFTLIELLISCGIIALVSSLVLVKYSAFDSTTLLKSTAYDMALTLREAQIKSVSVVNNGTSVNAFNYPYGVTFTDTTTRTNRGMTNKMYAAFRFEDTNTAEKPRYNIDNKGVNIGTTTIGRSMYVSDICIRFIGDDEDEYDCSINRLDISFRRPEYTALFWSVGGNHNIESAKIKVTSPNATTVFVTEVTRLGQISVYKE